MIADPPDDAPEDDRNPSAGARERRRGAALRANLGRRKQQARARAADVGRTAETPPDPAEED